MMTTDTEVDERGFLQSKVCGTRISTQQAITFHHPVLSICFLNLCYGNSSQLRVGHDAGGVDAPFLQYACEY